ncbi:MAG: hypothetical protein HY816_19890 [Candidatus Wallbacteria bacterium]|nr:hypothetical protein [Candidatus Wallbacteria bacterium]
MNPFQSRKATIGWLVTMIATALSGLAVSNGWVPEEKRGELLLHLSEVIAAVWSVIAMAIGVEDAGAKVAVPTPEEQKPPAAPPVALLCIVASLGMAFATPALAETSPADVLDLARLQRASTGRQNDPGTAWPAGFVVRRPVVVFVVEETATGDLYLVDPDELAEGRAGLHPWLVAVGRFGTVTTRQKTQRLISAEVRGRLRLAMQRAALRVAADLPTALSGQGPAILGAVLRAVVGMR